MREKSTYHAANAVTASPSLTHTSVELNLAAYKKRTEDMLMAARWFVLPWTQMNQPCNV